jgi:hypothetical protein
VIFSIFVTENVGRRRDFREIFFHFCVSRIPFLPDDAINSEIIEAEKLLRDLYPLEFRVEILEDVFSLLFVRSSDLEEGHLPETVFGMDATDTDTNSLRSWSSAAKLIRDGFSCCSDRLVQKVLQMLKDVVISTDAVRSKDSLASACDMPFFTSVTKGEIHSRLNKLQQRLTDASWRLNVVTFPKDIPMSLNSAYADDLVRPSFLTRKLEVKKSARFVQKNLLKLFRFFVIIHPGFTNIFKEFILIFFQITKNLPTIIFTISVEEIFISGSIWVLGKKKFLFFLKFYLLLSSK